MLGEPNVVDRTSQPEIGELHARQVVFEHDVRGLDVAVNEPLGVCGGEAGCMIPSR